jgi:hypothetical protein
MLPFAATPCSQQLLQLAMEEIVIQGRNSVTTAEFLSSLILHAVVFNEATI